MDTWTDADDVTWLVLNYVDVEIGCNFSLNQLPIPFIQSFAALHWEISPKEPNENSSTVNSKWPYPSVSYYLLRGSSVL